jgi:hypothetical protein
MALPEGEAVGEPRPEGHIQAGPISQVVTVRVMR